MVKKFPSTPTWLYKRSLLKKRSLVSIRHPGLSDCLLSCLFFTTRFQYFCLFISPALDCSYYCFPAFLYKYSLLLLLFRKIDLQWWCWLPHSKKVAYIPGLVPFWVESVFTPCVCGCSLWVHHLAPIISRNLSSRMSPCLNVLTAVTGSSWPMWTWVQKLAGTEN